MRHVSLALSILETPKPVLWQTVKYTMGSPILYGKIHQNTKGYSKLNIWHNLFYIFCFFFYAVVHVIIVIFCAIKILFNKIIEKFN